MPLARQYAHFISRLAWRDLPDDVRAATFDRFADWFANAVAGYGSPLTLALRAVAPGGGVAVRAGDLESADPLFPFLERRLPGFVAGEQAGEIPCIGGFDLAAFGEQVHGGKGRR